MTKICCFLWHVVSWSLFTIRGGDDFALSLPQSAHRTAQDPSTTPLEALACDFVTGGCKDPVALSLALK